MKVSTIESSTSFSKVLHPFKASLSQFFTEKQSAFVVKKKKRFWVVKEATEENFQLSFFRWSFFVSQISVYNIYSFFGLARASKERGNIFPSQLCCSFSPFLLQQKLFLRLLFDERTSSYFICFNLFSFPHFLYLIFILFTSQKSCRNVFWVSAKTFPETGVKRKSSSWAALAVTFVRFSISLLRF